MLKIILARLQQKHRTMAFPDGPAPELPDRFRGRPLIDEARCVQGCHACVQACPTGAITLTDKKASIDLGKCLFCTDCINACPEQAISASPDYRLAVHAREDLIVTQDQVLPLAKELEARIKKLLGRSLKLRQVSAGGCNACEADANVLTTLAWDLGRFGIDFVASPRHADGLLITGPVTENMREALLKTYEAVPSPKVVIAVGACALSGGIFAGHAEAHNGVDGLLPVDLYVPGCPPHPLTLLDGLLRLIGRIG